MSNTQSALVSVLITAYNRERYIAEAIESVLASDYSNFEVIVVDDCSKDNTVAIANEFAYKDNRVHVYVNDKNLDQFHNRNKAAGFSKGKYIKYCDSDDKLFPWTLTYCVEMMEKYPDAGMGILYFQNRIEEEYLLPVDSINKNFFDKTFLEVGPSGIIYKTKDFIKAGFFKPDYGVPSDLYFNLKMASLYPLVLLKKEFFFYRVHNEQEFKNKYSYLCFNYKYLHDAFKLPGFPLTEVQKNHFLKKAKRGFVKQFFSYIKNHGSIMKAIKAVNISGIGIKGFLIGIFQ